MFNNKLNATFRRQEESTITRECYDYTYSYPNFTNNPNIVFIVPVFFSVFIYCVFFFSALMNCDLTSRAIFMFDSRVLVPLVQSC